MIELLIPNAKRGFVINSPRRFEDYQDMVGGYIECIPYHILSSDYHILMNEDGITLNLPVNKLATARFERDILMPPHVALGVWIVLSGKDLLE